MENAGKSELDLWLQERQIEIKNNPLRLDKVDDRLWRASSALASKGIRPDGALIAQYRANYNYKNLEREEQLQVTITNAQRNGRRNVFRVIPF